MKYIFILGQSAAIAKQEILNILAKDSKKDIIIGQNFILADSTENAADLIKSLGGTIKIAKLVDTMEDLSNLTTEKWQSYLEEKLTKQKKNYFGFSLYNGSHKEQEKLSQTAFELKKQLKEKYRVRFVTSKRNELSSVIVAKNHLLGTELIVVKHVAKETNKYFIGLTQSVQDFVAYGKRDIARPGKDSKSGMLPPKLAQMMINMAGESKDSTLLDPFCGYGTILQEAVLMGYKEIYGTDKEERAIKDSRANIEWLKKHFPNKAKVQIDKINVKNLAQHFKDKKIDLIVTEPFMGDARFVVKQRKAEDLQELKSELQELYNEAFHQFKKILSPEGKIVFVFPIFNLREQKVYTLNRNILTNIGFKIIKPDIKSGNLSPEGNLLYSRPGQKVEREISVWQKTL
ncbi:hypothetical protein C0580_03350 [Candidatus Parcubacteria bacterium]|nr:MAG: hypothetical protein C0580_03350 [Candidatus Parcubacteria bacterium]